ncbi:uncharacterized protein LOC116342869 [Contarinia nasturtii]|uniref:uncharacterized protein LOC116342869 n=1 Tax=Contarinia nasturtii TaxID=265458 RepID=UPI0012D41A39|nr:uncharacterized protein LOC116342869 [Contarinia nasturtii]
MKYTIEHLSYIVPAISIGFLFIITSINIYFKIRRRFPVTVNCWFCNEDSRVPYDDLNKFTCPKCEQYNGFAEDGDYNCDIPAQRSAKLNKWKTSSFSSINGGSIINGRLMPYNGLCEPCNRNQELKVQQLASFEPENEAYFDEEVEDYRHKLEQAYRLCPRCERHLKRTLNKVKTNILGSKLKQIGAKGLQAFNLTLNQKSNKAVVYKKRLTFARISLAALVVISLLQSFTVSNRMNITKPKLDSIFNDNTTTFILTILSYISAMKILVLQFIQYILELPYISFIGTCAQMSIKYVYTYVSGDFWKVITTEIFELVEINVNDATDLNPGYSTVTTNVSGCFLSVFLLFMFGLCWGPVISLLLWSLGMILPTLIQETNNLEHTLVLDFVQLLLVWSTASLSIINFFVLPNKQIETISDHNSSFHRIDSDMNSDYSDESETESLLNTSMRSDISTASKRSMWNETRVLNSTIASKTPSIYSTNSLRRRSYGLSTQSIATTRTAASDINTSFGSERGFYRGSQMDLTRDRLHTSQRSFISAKSPVLCNRSQCPSAMSLQSLNKTYFNAVEPNPRSASRNSFYDVPNDFESGITHLSISGGKHFNSQMPSRTSGSWDLVGDTLRNKKAILSPSRLSLNETHHSVNQSWLAGGYWNSTSPQKKSTHPTNEYKVEQRPAAKEIFPMMSRASSKSSGFESRENSLCDDSEVERTFIVAEPTSMTHTTKLNNGLIKPQPQKPDSYQQPVAFPPSSTSSDVFANPNNKKSPNFKILSRSFSQFSLQQPQTPSHFQDDNSMLSSSQSFSSNLNQFNTANKDLPITKYQRGSLIKLHDHAMDH